MSGQFLNLGRPGSLLGAELLAAASLAAALRGAVAGLLGAEGLAAASCVAFLRAMVLQDILSVTGRSL
jgi:hypothetical protein